MNWNDAVKSSEGYWKQPERSWKFWDICCMGDHNSLKPSGPSPNQNSVYDAEKEITHYWSKEDDRKLIKLVTRYGQDWDSIAAKFHDKMASQLERRWINKLDPNTKRTPWTEEEDIVLGRLVLELGYNWESIAKYMQGRTVSSIKNRFINSILPFLGQNELSILQEKLTHVNSNSMEIDSGSTNEQNKGECLEFLYKKIQDLQSVMDETKGQIEKLENELYDSQSLLS